MRWYVKATNPVDSLKIFLLLKGVLENEEKKMFDEVIYRNAKDNFQHMLKIPSALQLLRLTLCVGLTLSLKPSLLDTEWNGVSYF